MKENYFPAVLTGLNVKENYFLGACDWVNLEEKIFLELDRGWKPVLKIFPALQCRRKPKKNFLQGMERYKKQLEKLKEEGNLRSLPKIEHCGHWVGRDGNRMLNRTGRRKRGRTRTEWMNQKKPRILKAQSLK